MFRGHFRQVALVILAIFLVTPFALAEDFDWRNFNGQNWITPVQDQGSAGTCWAFTATAAVEAKYKITRNDSLFNLDLSEQNLVCGGVGTANGGGRVDDAFDYYLSTGCVRESELHYTASDSALPGEWPLQTGWQDRVVKITAYVSGPRLDQISLTKDYLKTHGPLGMHMSADSDWYPPGVYRGSHAVMIVGFHDDSSLSEGGYWIVKNSWGTDWGDNGYGKILYGDGLALFSLYQGIAYATGAWVTATWQGGGIWQTGLSNWASAGQPHSWVNEETKAVFDTVGGPVTISGTVIAHALTLNPGATGYTFAGGPLTLTAGGITANESLAINSNITLGAPQAWTVSAGKTLSVGGNINTHMSTLAVAGEGDVSISGSLIGPNSLTKTGSGTLALGGDSPGFTGATSVGAGTLRVMNSSGSALGSGTVTIQSGATMKAMNAAGSITGSGAVAIQSGGTLAGTGFVGGSTTAQSGSHIAPGDGGAGVLTINNSLGLGNNIFLDFDLGAPNAVAGTGGNDLLRIAGGDLTMGMGMTTTVTPGANWGKGVYHLVNYAGSLSDNSSNFTGWTVAGNGLGTREYVFGIDGTSKLINLTVVSSGCKWNGSASSAWSSAVNWGGGAPGPYDPAILTSDGSHDPTNQDIPGLVIHQLRYASAATRSFDINTGNALTVNCGMVLDAAAADQTISLPITLGQSQIWSIGKGRTLTVKGNVDGAAGLTVDGGGTLCLAGATGAVAATDGITLKGGAALTLHNDGANGASNTDRISDGANLTIGASGTWPNASGGGVLSFRHTGGAQDYAETVGTLVLNPGQFTANLDRADAGQSSCFKAGAISRNKYSTARFVGSGLGRDSRNQFIMSGAPGLTDGVLPWAVVCDDTLAKPYHFATHNGDGTSITAFTGETDPSPANWGTTGNMNVRPTADVTLSGNRTITTLTLDNGVDLLGPSKDRLLVTSAILQTGGTSVINNSGGKCNHIQSPGGIGNSNEIFLHIVGTLIMKDASTGDSVPYRGGYWIKSGPGTWRLEGNQSYWDQQGVRINEGWLEVAGSDLVLNDSPAYDLCLSGGNFRIKDDTSRNLASAVRLHVQSPSIIESDRATPGAAVTHQLAGPLALYGQKLTVSKGANVTSGTAGFRIGGTTTLNATTDVEVTSGTQFEFGGEVGGAGGITKSGSGTLLLAGPNTYSGGTTVAAGALLVNNTTGFGTGTGAVTVGAATLGGTGFINGPVTLAGDSTLTSTAALTISNTLTVQGLANQLSGGTVLTSGDVTIDPGAVFIINGTLGGNIGSLVIYGTLMGKGTINKSCVIEAGGVLSPGAPSTIQGMSQMVVGGGPQTLAFEIGAAAPNYASPANSLNDLVRLTDATAPFADATGGAPAALSADTVIDVYFLWSDPALGGYKAEFFAATDFSDAVAGATYGYWRLDPRGNRYHNGNFYSPLDESLVDWSVVPETATFDGQAASGYITEFTVMPEPATLALVAMGTVAMLVRRRKR